MIDYHDLNAIHNVFNGILPRTDIAFRYSLKRAALVGITILYAANDPETLTKKGMFGDLLATLVTKEGVDSYAGNTLVAASRDMKQHSSINRAGNQLRLTPDPLLIRLLEDNPHYREQAAQWYNEALATLRKGQGRASITNAPLSQSRAQALQKLPQAYCLSIYGHGASAEELRQLAASLLEIAERYPD